MKGFVGLLLSLSLISCTEKPTYVDKPSHKLSMSASAVDVRLPTKLWDDLEKVYKPLVTDLSAVEQEGSSVKLDMPTDFFGFSVYLIEKTRGLLGGKNLQLVFGKGGGTLDFKDFLELEKGSFYFGLQPDLNLEKDHLQVYLLSNSVQRSVDGETAGSGCNAYLDITKHFNSSMTREGWMVNVTDGRHVSLLAGSYFLAVSIRGKLYLSQLTIRDSRYKKLHCKWI